MPTSPAAPQQGAPLFSEDYLAERELNRTGQLPTDVKKNSHRCNSSKSKKHRHDPSQHDQQLKMEHDSKHAVLPVSHAASTRATAKDQRPAGAMLELAPAGAVPSVDHSVLVVSTSSNITTDNGYAPSSSDTNITHGSDQGRGYPVPASSASAAAVGGGAVGGGTGSDAGSGGLALPFKPLSVSFNNISYFVDLPAVSQGRQQLKQFKAVCWETVASVPSLHKVTGPVSPSHHLLPVPRGYPCQHNGLLLSSQRRSDSALLWILSLPHTYTPLS